MAIAKAVTFRNTFQSMLVAAVLMLVAVAFRLAMAFAGGGHEGGLWNFAPVAAIALCGGAFLPRKLAFILPLSILLVSDLLLNWRYEVSLLDLQMIARYAALTLTVCLGLTLRNRSAITVLLGSMFASAMFYVVTNTGSWIDSPHYAKTVAGWVQALTVGVPGWPPTYLFFRNTVISDLLFTGLFVACQAWSSHPAAEAPPATTEDEPAPAHGN
jgi:hypothetical protein